MALECRGAGGADRIDVSCRSHGVHQRMLRDSHLRVGSPTSGGGAKTGPYRTCMKLAVWDREPLESIDASIHVCVSPRKVHAQGRQGRLLWKRRKKNAPGSLRHNRLATLLRLRLGSSRNPRSGDRIGQPRISDRAPTDFATAGDTTELSIRWATSSF